MVLIRIEVVLKILSPDEIIQKMSMGRVETMTENQAVGQLGNGQFREIERMYNGD